MGTSRMRTVVAIGERCRVEGFRLAGARVVEADDDEAVRAAWQSLGPDVSVVVLTPAAARAIDYQADRADDDRVVLMD